MRRIPGTVQVSITLIYADPPVREAADRIGGLLWSKKANFYLLPLLHPSHRCHSWNDQLGSYNDREKFDLKEIRFLLRRRIGV